jgi:sugar diacid utilization regulator
VDTGADQACDASLDRGEITVARLLQERMLRESDVLTGHAHLGRVVHWCHPLEVVQDDRDHLGGVAIVASDAQLDGQLVERLVSAGAPALLVCPRAAEPVDASGALDEAERSGLVVVRLPSGTAPRRVSELVARLNLAHESHVLQYAQRIHGALAQLLHRGAGLNALCSRMARHSECSVAILHLDLHLMAFDPGPNRLDAMTVTTALRAQPGLLEDTVAAQPDVHGVGTVSLTVADQPVTAIVAAIELAERRDGWLMLLDAKWPPNQHDMAEHRVVVEQAATIVGTELLRVRGLERAEERARGNFVHALLHSRFTNHAELVARASHYDFDVDQPYGVIVAQVGGLMAHGDSPARLAEWAREATRLPQHGERPTLATVVGDVIAIVRPVSPPRRSQPHPGDAELHSYAHALERRLSGQTDHTVLIAYGRPVRSADSILESYREARIALDLRQRLNVQQVCGFADLRVDSVLLDLAQAHGGREFATEVLGPLEGERDGSLVGVIQVYIESGGNLNEAARRLAIHRNTMQYKLERISRLLHRDVREADTQFMVWLALRLRSLAETAESVDRDVRTG